MASVTPLQQINPDKISQNPDNPRLIFREAEMNELMESIREVGIKVPLSVYSDGARFTLIDGERRWRCAKKLNLHSVPAIVQPKPSRLENLLMMFNIHNVRVDWDLMPMALKLGQIREMLQKEGKFTNAKSLSAVTGVRLSTVQRALDLLDLPQKYQKMLLREAEKPRGEQRIKPDVFIEVYKSMHVVERYVPEVFEQVTKAEFVDSMVSKYVDHVVDNVVGYRELSKIARAERAGVGKEHASPTIVKLVRDKTYSVKQAFEDTVQTAYDQRDLSSKLQGITTRLSRIPSGRKLDANFRTILLSLKEQIDRILGINK
jgi:ParB family transcriptional regulator, chromosome partitioning protein